MGAADFMTFQAGQSHAQAFRAARDHTRFEHGNGLYTGTIAEKTGYVMFSSLPMSRAAATSVAQGLLSNEDPRVNDKDGPAACIPVAQASAVSARQVSVVLDNLSQQDTYLPAIIDAAARALAAKLKPGERVVDVERTSNVQVKRKVTTEATTGGTKISYLIRKTGGEKTTSGKTYPTQSAARQALNNFMRREEGIYRGDSDESYEIVGIVTRANGEPLVRGKAEVIKRTLSAKVTIEISPAPNAPIAGYLFFGYARE